MPADMMSKTKSIMFLSFDGKRVESLFYVFASGRNHVQGHFKKTTCSFLKWVLYSILKWFRFVVSSDEPQLLLFLGSDCCVTLA